MLSCWCVPLCCSASFGGPEEESAGGAPERTREEEEEVSSSAAATPMASDAAPTEFSHSEAYRFNESWDTFSPSAATAQTQQVRVVCKPLLRSVCPMLWCISADVALVLSCHLVV